MEKRTKKLAAVGVAIAAVTAGLLSQLVPSPPEPLPLYAYEGQTILGYDIPPRLYILIEENTHRSKLDNPECKPAAFNWPCVVYKNDETVKLHVFRCVDPRDVTNVKFDQVSCKNQRDYFESFER